MQVLEAYWQVPHTLTYKRKVICEAPLSSHSQGNGKFSTASFHLATLNFKEGRRGSNHTIYIAMPPGYHHTGHVRMEFAADSIIHSGRQF